MSSIRGIGEVPLIDSSSSTSPVGGKAKGAESFADALGKALQATDQLQLQADHQAEQVALGGGNLHETALALEKADISMRVAVKVRNKMVDAYQEIMRMSV